MERYTDARGQQFDLAAFAGALGSAFGNLARYSNPFEKIAGATLIGGLSIAIGVTLRDGFNGSLLQTMPDAQTVLASWVIREDDVF